MPRFRIDFTLKEIDVPEGEEVRGISFGDDVNVDEIADFFDRSRDAAKTLFCPRTVTNQQRRERLEEELILARVAARSKAPSMGVQGIQGKHSPPRFPGDDGSHGGDGPMNAEALAWYAAHGDTYGRDHR